MHTTGTRFFGTLVAIASATALGCGNADPMDAPTESGTAALLEQENGGLSTTDEAPDFADTAVTAAPALSADVGTDALLDDTGASPGDTTPATDRHVYRVLLLWGHMPTPNDGAAATAPAAPPSPTDWTGSVSLAGAGVVSVRRTVGFDAMDRVQPRDRMNPGRVDFVSHTQPFVDGLALTVRTTAATASLRFQTAATTLDLPLPDADGNVTRLADGRNGVYYAAYEERPSCNQGFVFGHWGRMRAHLGVFRGHVLDAVGAPRGTVRGLWGARRTGQHVFFGKHISNGGMFNGLLGGTYDAGHFQGVWGLRDGQRGELHGRYFDGVERADGRGVFLGRWREVCR